MKKLISSKVLSVQVFVVVCLVTFGTLILCYVNFGSEEDVQEEIPANSLKKLAFQTEKCEEPTPKCEPKLKNILMWTHEYTEPFKFLRLGREHFITAGCQYNNCYLSHNKTFLDNITEWDAVLFHAPEYTKNGNIWNHPYPKARSSKQEYILVSIESGGNYPVCDQKWENYFNWTMTYMLDSDVPWEYVTIRDSKSNRIVGPGDHIPWNDKMSSLPDDKINSLNNKTKAAAWFVSNCYTLGRRETYAEILKKEMEELGMVLDVFGKCGQMTCDKSTCDSEKKLREEYFFYLSFENSFNTDYVTEKLLTAMQNNVVPIVWGGANYTRFAPPNSYINAREMSPKDLASLLHRLVNNIDEYAEYLKWQQYYSYHSVYDSYETHPLCKLCKALNDPLMTDTPRVRGDIRSWWNGEGNKNC